MRIISLHRSILRCATRGTYHPVSTFHNPPGDMPIAANGASRACGAADFTQVPADCDWLVQADLDALHNSAAFRRSLNRPSRNGGR